MAYEKKINSAGQVNGIPLSKAGQLSLLQRALIIIIHTETDPLFPTTRISPLSTQRLQRKLTLSLTDFSPTTIGQCLKTLENLGLVELKTPRTNIFGHVSSEPFLTDAGVDEYMKITNTLKLASPKKPLTLAL